MVRSLHLPPVIANLFLFAAFLLCPSAHAAQVDEVTARRVAEQFLVSRSPQFADLRAQELELVLVEGATGDGSAPGTVYYRIFNAGTQGFVVVAGDDILTPVLAYSITSAYGGVQLPINAAKWFEFYKEEIADALANGVQASAHVAAAWGGLVAGAPPAGGERSVNPLCTTTWNQPPPYNTLCPGGSVTGCVATAMAQVMKYHNHPAQGAGFHSYNAPNYGTLSANFGATTYQWGSMPNAISTNNNAIATLMYHCGVSVDMQYSTTSSGAWVLETHSPTTDHNAQYALRTYFGYGNDIQGVYRDNNSLTQWNNLLKAELDAGRPIIYAGFGQGGGHCFVCDGYDNNSFFHFNWGWGGAYDGFFAMDALNPDGQGTGGGSGAYNSNQEALINIHPATGGGGGGGGGGETADLILYNAVTPSPATIYYGQAFSVSTNILNNGTNDFNGDYCAAVFDAASNFYGYVQTYTGENLPAGYVYNQDLVFSSSGMFSMVPGTYYLGIFYRTNGGEWTQVADNGGYVNFPQITVINPNDIELSLAMTPSPGSSVQQGQQFSVNVNVQNTGGTTFFGDYKAALYNLDGSFAQDLGTLTENNGLPPGYEYVSPYLNFGPVPITLAPGTYLLAILHNPNNSGWQLTGSSYYQNPIFITVTEAGISPDQYEVNNNAGQSYQLPVNFSGNLASTNTTGSNLHVNTDVDFFKVVLAGGNNYAITARIHDSYNSGNGNSYTLDGLWSYSTDGTNWSQAYDDVMNGDILVNGGGTVYFRISPYFAGETGTYLLQLNIERGLNVGVDEAQAADLAVHPNPARDILFLDAGNEPVLRTELLDAQGRLSAVLNFSMAQQGRLAADVSGLSEGAYLLRVTTASGIRTRPLIIAR